MKIVLGVVRWLGLFVGGWAAYAVGRALLAAMALDVPWYDWQMYLALWLLIVWIMVGLANYWPKRSVVSLGVSSVLLLWLVVGYNGFGQTVTLHPSTQPPVKLNFWAFFLPGVLPEQTLAEVGAGGGDIYLTIRSDAMRGEDGAALAAEMRHWHELGITVYMAPPFDGPYGFLAETNHQEWITKTYATAAFVQQEQLAGVCCLIGDAEMPVGMTADQWGLDQPRFAAMVANYQAFLPEFRQRYPNLQVGLTAGWILYLDGWDGDPDLAIAHRTAVDPPEWDYLSSMTYSSYFKPETRTYLLYLVERAVARRYPGREIVHLLGVAGGGMPGEPLLDFDELVRDARLSRALGQREVGVFQLNGLVTEFGPDIVGRLATAVNDPQAPPIEVPFVRAVSVIIYGALLSDALLDVRGWGALLWLAWGGVCAVFLKSTFTANS